MIDINMACELAIQNSPDERVAIITDIGHSFVLGMVGIHGEEIDQSPLMVNKQTGDISICFPPEHWRELKNGKLVATPKAYRPLT